MSIRLKCRACRAAFVTSDEQLGRAVTCPKCGVKQTVPATLTVETPKPQKESVFVPAADAGPARRGHPVLWSLLFLMIAAGGGGVVAWPRIRAWLHPLPPDPIAAASSNYLRALVEGNAEDSARLSTIDDHPGLRAFRSVKHDRKTDRKLKGSFRPIAAMHGRILETYVYDPKIGRFTPANPLGPAAETLDALHDAKAKMEQDEVYKKLQSADLDEVIDGAMKHGTVLTKLAEGVLNPKRLIPSYKQLILDAKPPLPAAERELALDFGENAMMWDALLKRPFPTLKADGPFILDRAETSAMVTDKLASSGDPPTRLHLKLVRFRLEGIDTGWKVVSARREGEAETIPSVAPVSKEETPKRSPGER